MTLINTNGFVIFGQGSEWFWSMLQFVIVAVTLIGLYRQLRLQSNASAIAQIESFERDWTSERNTRYALDVLIGFRDGTDPAEVPTAAAEAIAGFWENVGSLTRAGHIDQKLLWNGQTARCQSWWATLAPFARRLRAERDDPRIYEEFEWLAGLMAQIDQRAGAVENIYEEGVYPNGRSALERRIAGYLDQLRVEQALRAVIVQSPETAIVRPMSPATLPAPPPAAKTKRRAPTR